MEGAHYEVLRVIGEGGMGVVYEGVHRPSGESVAIKMVARMAKNPAMRRLMLDEATAAAHVVHPNIVRLLDLGRDADGEVFLTMELVRGHDLESWIEEWPGWDRVLSAFQGMVSGLAVAHASGIVHGDLKPSNVLLDASGGAKITDFGIATLVDPLSGSTERKGIAGTPLYMSPEQMSGEGSGPWSDLYAIGVMLAELCGGRPPFEAGTLIELYGVKRRGAPMVIPRPHVNVPDEVLDLIRDLLEPHPRKRLRFAAEVHERLVMLEDVVVGRDTMIGFAPSIVRTRTDDSQPTIMDSATMLVRQDSRPSTGPISSGRLEPVSRRLPFHLPSDSLAGPGGAVGLLRPPPLVGRDYELTRLMDQVQSIRADGGARVMVLLGGAGVGKSRLARVGLAEVERLGLMEGIAAGYDASGSSVAGGLKQALKRVLALVNKSATHDDLAWLESADSAAILGWLSDTALVLPHEAAELAYRTVRAISQRRPVYLWLDDVGWARDGAAEFVERLVAAQDANVLVVATLRRGTADHPEVRAWLDRLANSPRVSFEQLGVLAERDRRTLLDSLAPLSPNVKDVIAKLDETPLVLVQAVRDWIDSGTLVPGPNGYEPKPGTTAVSLLAGRSDVGVINQRIEAMLSAFGATSQRALVVLSRMALLGVRFTEPALRAATNDDALVDEVLDRALIVGLLRLEAERTYRFDHGLFQEALLSRLAARPEHSDSYIAVARALVHTYGDHHTDVLLRAAELHRKGGAPDDADRALYSAARNFGRGGHFDGALDALEQLARNVEVDGVPPVHARRALLEHTRGAYHFFKSEYEEALAHLAVAADIAKAIGDADRSLRVDIDTAAIYFYQDRLRECESLTYSVAERGAGSPDFTFSALHRLSELASLRGDFEGALVYEQRAAAQALAGSSVRLVVSIVTCAELCLVLGRIDDAERFVQKARESEAQLDATLRADIDDTVMHIDLVRGNYSRQRLRVAQRLADALRRGDLWRTTAGRLFDAYIEAADGSDAAAKQTTEAFIEAYTRAHHDEALSWWVMDRLATHLRARGLVEHGDRVATMLADRKAELARAFA